MNDFLTKVAEQGDLAGLVGFLFGPLGAGIHGAVASPDGEGSNYGWRQFGASALGGLGGGVAGGVSGDPNLAHLLARVGSSVGAYQGRKWGRKHDKTRQRESEKQEQGKTAALRNYGLSR